MNEPPPKPGSAPAIIHPKWHPRRPGDIGRLLYLVYGTLRGESLSSVIPFKRAYRSIKPAVIWCEDKLGLPHATNMDGYTNMFGTFLIRDDVQESFFVTEKMKLDKATPGDRTQERGEYLNNEFWLVCERRADMVHGPADGSEDDFAARTRWTFSFRVLYVCTSSGKALERKHMALFAPIGSDRSCEIKVVPCVLY